MDSSLSVASSDADESVTDVAYRQHRKTRTIVSSSDEKEEAVNDSFEESETECGDKNGTKNFSYHSAKSIANGGDNESENNLTDEQESEDDQGPVASSVKCDTSDCSEEEIVNSSEPSPRIENDDFKTETVVENSFTKEEESDGNLSPFEPRHPVGNSTKYEHTDCTDDEDIINGSESNSRAQTDDSDVEAIVAPVQVVELSSEEESAAHTEVQPLQTLQNQPRTVSSAEYEEQVRKIANLQQEALRTKNAQRVIRLENLPDKGLSLMQKQKSLEEQLQQEKAVLETMAVVMGEGAASARNKVEVKWDEIEAGVDAVGPRTLGKIGVANFTAEKNMALETLTGLHKSLATCPTENDLMEDPKGLKVPLMPHQRRALAWLLWRENQKPSGGLLADDMGLGKTLTMISLILKSMQLQPDQQHHQDKENHRDKYLGGTLVVCPASLLNQWSGEVASKTKRGLLSVEVYHGPKRETKPKRLAKNDMVITTYAIVLSERERDGALFGVKWRRIVLDEAHQIRNYKARTSEAVFTLSGKSRWALTGTPVHNKELDMYAQLKFLRCSPFDDLKVWKHWVSDKSTGGQMRLQAVVSSLMLRRTKEELMQKGTLKSLPTRTWELIAVSLDKDETAVYQKVLIFSRTLFAQFLHQRASKNQDVYDMKFNRVPNDPNGEYFKMRNKLLKLNKVKEVNQHDILVLLLRLRQICCHPSLITKMLQGDEDLGNADSDEDSEELNLLEQLNKINLNEEEDVSQGLHNEPVGLSEASKGYLNPSNPVFVKERPSSKIRTLVELVKEKISSGDKAIIVSQWTGLLELVGLQLKISKIIYDSLDGTIPVNKRMPIVDNFNDPNSATRVLLLSLTAGGVGLNLIGANHLFLMDLHWNPQLENQAQDRIYRMGQEKPIFVYKLMALDTIEERIKLLQERKLEVAQAMLTGSKKVIQSKLSLQDLKLLFDFK